MDTKPTFRSQFRLPAQLHEKLEAARQESGRSLNGELVYRLERALEINTAAERKRSIAEKELADAFRRASKLIEKPRLSKAEEDALAEALQDVTLWQRQVDKILGLR